MNDIVAILLIAPFILIGWALSLSITHKLWQDYKRAKRINSQHKNCGDKK